MLLCLAFGAGAVAAQGKQGGAFVVLGVLDILFQLADFGEPSHGCVVDPRIDELNIRSLHLSRGHLLGAKSIA